MPFLLLFGNETLTIAARSYCGNLNVVFMADRAACPGVDTVVRGMNEAWTDVSQIAAAA